MTWEEYFKDKVVLDPGMGCLIWTGMQNSDGYGSASYRGKLIGAHRLSYRLKFGFTPPSCMHLMHKCDNRLCCEPFHLDPGTRRENMADKVRKGRQPRGEMCSSAKLTAHAAASIRSDTRSIRQIAKHYGVSRVLVWKVLTGRAWAEPTRHDDFT